MKWDLLQNILLAAGVGISAVLISPHSWADSRMYLTGAVVSAFVTSGMWCGFLHRRRSKQDRERMPPPPVLIALDFELVRFIQSIADWPEAYVPPTAQDWMLLANGARELVAKARGGSR